MKVGYPSHFSGAVEAASSTGGQITPPILGAAIIMVEYLDYHLETYCCCLISCLLFRFLLCSLEVKN